MRGVKRDLRTVGFPVPGRRAGGNGVSLRPAHRKSLGPANRATRHIAGFSRCHRRSARPDTGALGCSNARRDAPTSASSP